MFDLEKQIQSWRELLLNTLDHDAVDELESHLRDDVEHLVRDGKSTEEAWQIAITRLGDAKSIAGEFARSGRSVWLPGRVALGLVIASAILVLVSLSLRSSPIGLLLASHIFTVTIGYLATFAFGISAISAIVARARGTFTSPRERAFRSNGAKIAAISIAFTAIGIILGMLWSRDHLYHYWQWDPRKTGGLCVLAWNCIVAASLRRNTQPVLCGVMGNVVVLFAWFVAAPLIDRPWLWVVVMSQLALIYVALGQSRRIAINV